jgi:3-methyladenine DNA glycosylase AlkC
MPTLLKDYYDRPFVARLARAVAADAPGFDGRAFTRAVLAAPWPGLALKQRMRRITAELGAHLPGPYARQLAVLERIASGFTGLTALVFPDFVELFGQHDPARSLPALAHFTRFSTSEFAIRPFIARDPEGTMAQMRRWAADADEHVRRLASEGCRPRLPWGMALQAFKRDPRPVLDVLERLKADPSEYVRRSVANNLNDIGKDHPDVLLEVAGRWRGQHADTDRLLKHACRTLLKRGDRRALALFGLGHDVGAEVRRLTVTPARVSIGGRIAFAFDVRHAAAGPVTLRLEYAVEFARPGGKSFRKVFQIAERLFGAGWHRVERRHAFRDLTTRTHHPGDHRLSVVVNGWALASARVTLNRASRQRARG